MSQYLCLRCGIYRLLLDIRHVVEIGGSVVASEAEAGRSMRRRWREGSLPALNLTAFLGHPPAASSQQIVICDEQGRQGIIDVDAVDDLRTLESSQFADIAALSATLQELIDAVAADTDSATCLLRLRHPFAWTSIFTDVEAP